jgi:hypothetical protein
MQLSGEDLDGTVLNRVDSRSMSWLTKLGAVIRTAARMRNPVMDDASWINAIVTILKEQNIRFLPAKRKSGLSAVCLQVLTYPQPQGSGVCSFSPFQQGPEVVNPCGSQIVTAHSGAVLPFSIPLHSVPECLAESIRKEIDIWKKAHVDADKISDVGKRNYSKQRSAALETFFAKSYAMLDIVNHYHHVLITTGLMLRLSDVIPNAEKDHKDCGPLDWVYKHSCNRDKDRWLLMFVITGVYYASRELQTEIESLLPKVLRDNIKTTLGIGPKKSFAKFSLAPYKISPLMFENLGLSTRTDSGTRGDPHWGKMRFKGNADCQSWLKDLELLAKEEGPRALLEKFFLPEKANTILDTFIDN